MVLRFLLGCMICFGLLAGFVVAYWVTALVGVLTAGLLRFVVGFSLWLWLLIWYGLLWW